MELDEETRDALGLGGVYERTESYGRFTDEGYLARRVAFNVYYRDEWMAAYRATPWFKAAVKAYRKSPKGKAAEARYVASEKRKASLARFVASGKPKAWRDANKAKRAEHMRLDRKAKKLGMTVAQYREHMAKVVQMPARKAAKREAA